MGAGVVPLLLAVASKGEDVILVIITSVFLAFSPRSTMFPLWAPGLGRAFLIKQASTARYHDVVFVTV